MIKITYHQFGEFGVQFLLVGHGQGGGHGLQAQGARPVHHAVRDLGGLVIPQAPAPTPPFQFGRQAFHFLGFLEVVIPAARGRSVLGRQCFKGFGQGRKMGMKAVELLGQVGLGQV